MQLFDAITVGSATLDLFLKSNEFTVAPDDQGVEQLSLRYGTKLNVEEFAMQSGGGATNVAVGLRRLGFTTAVIAEIGKDLPARAILDELKNEQVDTSFLVQEHDEKTAISALLIAADGDRSVVTARGAAQMLTVEDIPFSQLNCQWLHMSSIGNTPVVLELARYCKQHRIQFSWNPGGAELKTLEDGSLHLHEIFPTVLCVNAEEAERISAAGYDLETGGNTVIVTNGRKGGRYFEHGKWTEFAAQSSQVVQVTGAGDAFITGVIAAYLSNRLTPEAIRWGAANAASVVQHMGAKTGLLTAAALAQSV